MNRQLEERFSSTPSSPLSLSQMRLLIFVGAVSIAAFIYSDLQLLPITLHSSYLVSRLAFQIPLALVVIFLSYLPSMRAYLQTAIMLSLLLISYVNLGFIVHAWRVESFTFPYEGIVLYSFFALFVLRLDFKRAAIYSSGVLIGFLAIIATHPIYGPMNNINGGFVTITLVTGLFATYHLDLAQLKLASLNLELTNLSKQDPLTKLSNRRSFREQFQNTLNQCINNHHAIAVFMIDIDKFKEFNDNYGHLAGDAAIITQADILRAVFQSTDDILCRFGGEEFVAIRPNASLEESEVLAQQILNEWEKRKLPHDLSPNREFLTCSIGIFVTQPTSQDSQEKLLQRADEALYLAKENGRAQFISLV